MKAQKGLDASAYVSRLVQDEDKKVPAGEASNIAASFLGKLRRRIDQKRSTGQAIPASPADRALLG